MALERRRNSQYFYQKRRINGRVVPIYGGSGFFAEAQSLLAEAERQQKAYAAARWRAKRAEIERYDADDKELTARCRQLAAALMLVNGYHQHKRQWRKRRAMSNTIVIKLPRRPAPGDTSKEALSALLELCNTDKATQENIELLEALLPAHPHVVKLGDHINQALTRPFTENGIQKATVPTFIKQRKEELGYATAPALERPLILHLILCEQRLGVAEQTYSIALSMSTMTSKQQQYYEKRVTSAQVRYLRAVETLARIRRVRVEMFASDGTHAAGVAVERPA